MNELDSCDYFALQTPGTNNFIGMSKRAAAGHLTRSNIESLTAFTELPISITTRLPKPKGKVKIMWLYETKQ